ncbi:MAG: PilZ domain-containing protein [Candidatus Omnitrophica bacterium]|nr:PilZ domain-containing protein [Candidatus Omnitrophota bacterium]
MWQEKRVHKRITLSLPIDYEYLGTDKKECSSTVSKDVSEGGLRLALNKFYSPKTKFLLKINLEGLNRIIETIAEIAWSFNAQFSNRYYSGLRFVGMSSLDQRMLKEYIEMRGITKTQQLS